MTYKILLLGSSSSSVDVAGLDIDIQRSNWDSITPFQRYDMILVNNSSLNTQLIKIAKVLKKDFQGFVQDGGILVCLCSEPKNYGGYHTYDWLPVSPKLRTSKVGEQSHQIKRSMYEKFIQNQLSIMSPQCAFPGVNDSASCKVLLTTGLGSVLAFSIILGKGMIICLPQSSDEIAFLTNWFKFWLSKKPDWVEKFYYKTKVELQTKLKAISIVEKLLYGNDRELRDAVIEALRIFGFNANALPDGPQQDIDVSSGSFQGMVEVKGLKSHADRDDMRALLDYYDNNIGKQPNLKGIFVVNHYREAQPDQRGDPYTRDALEIANRKEFCLLTADDIYFAVERALNEDGVKEEMRKRITQGVGLTSLKP
jgi:hypothetical protein